MTAKAPAPADVLDQWLAKIGYTGKQHGSTASLYPEDVETLRTAMHAAVEAACATVRTAADAETRRWKDAARLNEQTALFWRSEFERLRDAPKGAVFPMGQRPSATASDILERLVGQLVDVGGPGNVGIQQAPMPKVQPTQGPLPSPTTPPPAPRSTP